MKDQAADGLRGFAAVNVLLCHLFIAAYPLGFRWMYPGTAVAGTPSGPIDAILAFPLMTLAFYGQWAVSLFFVLSGYVLTRSFLVSGDIGILRARAIRRYVRLGVPVFGAVLLAYAAMSLCPPVWVHAGELTGSLWLSGVRQPSSSAWDALKESLFGVLLSGESVYNPTLWTMKVELIGSTIVFAYRALGPGGRFQLMFGAALIVAFTYWFPDQWPYYAAFIIGSHIGELRLASSRLVSVGIAVIGCLLGGIDTSPHYEWTHIIEPADMIRLPMFQVAGSACLIYAVRSGAFGRILTHRIAQFLGRISYPLYLVHLPVLLTLYAGLIVLLVETLGWPKYTVILIAMPLTVAVVIPLALVFGATFDRWGIRLSRRHRPAPVCTQGGTDRASVEIS